MASERARLGGDAVGEDARMSDNQAESEIEDEQQQSDLGAALDPARGGAPDRAVERDEGPLSPSPTIGGSGGSGSRAVLPEGAETRGRRPA